jgi:hypothetical protein
MSLLAVITGIIPLSSLGEVDLLLKTLSPSELETTFPFHAKPTLTKFYETFDTFSFST